MKGCSVDCECSSTKLFVVFDLDGCLVRTRDLVEQAYREAGVIMPLEAWGLPWTDWLPHAVLAPGRLVEDVRREKSRIYLELLRTESVELLPPWEVMCSVRARKELGEAYDYRIISGAGLPAVQALLKHIGSDMSHVLGWEMTVERKAEVLNSLPRPDRRVVYVDDHATVAPLLRKDVFLVQYTDQTTEELMEEVWIRSSWQQVLTSD
jgi:hypothetical protein